MSNKRKQRQLETSIGVGTGTGVATAGLIGKADRFKRFKQPRYDVPGLLNKAKPGDILILGKGTVTGGLRGLRSEFDRAAISAFTGTPDFYHPVVVESVTNGKATVINMGPGGIHRYTIDKGTHDNINLLRRKSSSNQHLNVLQQAEKKQRQFEAALRKKGLSEQQISKFRHTAYETKKLLPIGIKEVFFPVGRFKKREATLEKQLRTLNIAQAADDYVKTMNSKSPTVPKCFQGVCTSYLGRAGALDKAQKQIKHLSPNDFLRSKEYQSIGVHFKPEKLTNKAYKGALRVAPLGLLGAGAIAAGLGSKTLVKEISNARK